MRGVLGVLIGGVMAAISACAPVPAPAPPSVDVSGTWEGTWTAFEGPAGAGDLRGVFRQDGATVYGNFQLRNQNNPAISRTYVSGVVTGNQVKLFAPNEGNLIVSGDEMTGSVQAIVRAQVRLRKLP
jgi:hypothetical protein